MNKQELRNKIGFQIGFLLYSGKSVEDVIEHIAQIAEKYANEKEDEQCTPIEK